MQQIQENVGESSEEDNSINLVVHEKRTLPIGKSAFNASKMNLGESLLLIHEN